MALNYTEVRLLAVPLEADYKDTFYFASVSAQKTYFLSKEKHLFTNLSYQRKDRYIAVPEHYDNLQDSNYLMYWNQKENKWYYAFIDKMEYKNDSTTFIYFTLDVMQTYMFNTDGTKPYTVLPSFVEREHVSSDAIGEHTMPENVEMGEYICNAYARDYNLNDYVYMLHVTEGTSGDKFLATNMGGIWTAGGFYVSETFNAIINVIQAFSNDESVIGCYMIPKKLLEDHNFQVMKYEGLANPKTYNFSIGKQFTLDGYTPKNKKLLCFPFNYLVMANNCGTSNILQYEHFYDAAEGYSGSDTCSFQIKGVPSVGGSVKCTPIYYKGIPLKEDEGIMLGKCPILSWSSDLYTNWLTQNSVNLAIGVASSAVSIVGGIGMMATGAGALAGGGMVVSGALGIGQTLGQIHQYEMTPNSAKGNVNGGDIDNASKSNTFYFYCMSIKSEYAKSIDAYFDMFGYKVNTVKVPNVARRSQWWYTKTIDVSINGPTIPKDDMLTIKNCYNNGIRFWRNPDNIGNYNLSNSIV